MRKIRIQGTPNGEFRAFIFNKNISCVKTRFFDEVDGFEYLPFTKRQHSLFKRFIGIEGVEIVKIGLDRIVVKKSKQASWELIKASIQKIIFLDFPRQSDLEDQLRIFVKFDNERKKRLSFLLSENFNNIKLGTIYSLPCGNEVVRIK